MANRGRLARRASLAAQLEYGPQVSALLTVMQQAADDYQGSVKASNTAATGVARSARRAIPTVRRVYGDAARRNVQQHSAVATALAGLGASADPYKASAATEEGAFLSRQADERARAVTELAARRTDARAGAAYEQRALRADLSATRNKIGTQLQQLTAEQGAATSKNLLDLLDAAANRHIDRARLDETQRHNRATEQNAARNAARRNGGVRLLTPEQQNVAFDKLEEARGWIRKLGRSNGTGRVRDMLRTGATLNVPMLDPAADQSNGPVYLTDTRGNTRTQKVTIPRYGKDLLNAAYDLEVLGYLSRPNVAALHARGLHIGRRYKVRQRGSNAPPGGVGPPSPRVGYAH